MRETCPKYAFYHIRPDDISLKDGRASLLFYIVSLRAQLDVLLGYFLVWRTKSFCLKLGTVSAELDVEDIAMYFPRTPVHKQIKPCQKSGAHVVHGSGCAVVLSVGVVRAWHCCYTICDVRHNPRLSLSRHSLIE